jgi:hypothetical protein
LRQVGSDAQIDAPALTALPNIAVAHLPRDRRPIHVPATFTIARIDRTGPPLSC